jgi:hypothetical protein
MSRDVSDTVSTFALADELQSTREARRRRRASSAPCWGVQAPVVTSMTTRLPSGLVGTVTGGRRAVLANANDPLSLTSLTDSTIVNGQLFRTVYTQADRAFTSTSPAGRQVIGRLDGKGRVTKVQTAGLDSLAITYDARDCRWAGRRRCRIIFPAAFLTGWVRVRRRADWNGRLDGRSGGSGCCTYTWRCRSLFGSFVGGILDLIRQALNTSRGPQCPR